jgi:oxygen-dependent protoporphyrinogen oxidase
MSHFDVIILGGGISGLTTAWKLAQAGISTLLLEKQSRPGGVITTVREGPWLMDTGPNSLSYKEGDGIHKILQELALGKELESRAIRESDRYVWRDGRLRAVPTSPVKLLGRSAVSKRTLARALKGMWHRHEPHSGDVSVGAYFSETIGRRAVDQLLTPVLAGIYAADPFALSLEAVMPRLHSALRQSSSLAQAVRAMRREAINQGFYADSGRRMLASFTDGMQTLPERVAAAAAQADATLKYSCAVSGVSGNSGNYTVATAEGENFTAPRIICTLPAHVAADVLENVAPDSAAVLRHIAYAPLVLVHVGVKEADVAVSCDGFGFLATRNAGVRSLGMIWSDRMFTGRAPQGSRLFTIFAGGQLDANLIKLSDDELRDVALQDLRTVMKWNGNGLEMTRITRWASAIPLLEVGHAERVRQIKAALPEGIVLSGNYVTGVAVPACMKSGTETAAKIADDLCGPSPARAAEES